MKNILLTLAATAALMVGGMTFTDTADARPRGWGSPYSGRYYAPNYGYRAYPRYGYGYRGYYGSPQYYGNRYYRYPGRYPGNYGSGFYFSTPRAGFYFY